MKKYRIIPFLIIILSCSTPNWYKPMGYMIFSMMPKGGSPGFNLGWMHGCESGLGSQFGGAFYMTFYTWKRDPDITSSKPDINKIKQRYKKELKDINWNNDQEVKKNFADYNMVFWDAHYFCRQTVLGTLQTAGMNPALPGGVRYDPAAHSIGSIYKINAKGDARLGSPAATGGYW